jgi:hypothetical protein
MPCSARGCLSRTYLPRRRRRGSPWWSPTHRSTCAHPSMERLNALGLPYCMLMPMNTLETDARQAALSEGHPLTLCVLARRARFLTSDGAIIRGAPMGCAWFCTIPDTVGGFVFPPY